MPDSAEEPVQLLKDRSENCYRVSPHIYCWQLEGFIVPKNLKISYDLIHTNRLYRCKIQHKAVHLMPSWEVQKGCLRTVYANHPHEETKIILVRRHIFLLSNPHDIYRKVQHYKEKPLNQSEYQTGSRDIHSDPAAEFVKQLQCGSLSENQLP